MITARVSRRIKTTLLILAAFFIPFLIMVFVYYACGMAPWGDKSVLIMDMSDQYVAFFAELRSIFEGESSIFFSWHKAFGCNFIGVFAYYLASPFSFITLLFPENQLPEALMWLTCIKIGLAGMSFALFLRLAFNKRPWAILLFACCYALMSYSSVYSLSIMWLDGLIFLPMIMLGIERLLKIKLKDTKALAPHCNLNKGELQGQAGPGNFSVAGRAQDNAGREERDAESSLPAARAKSQASMAEGDYAQSGAGAWEARTQGTVQSVRAEASTGTAQAAETGKAGRNGMAGRLNSFIFSFPWLLTLFFAVMFIANYYIAYMIGIFSVMYFLLRFFAQKPPRMFFRYFWRFCAGALLAAFLAAWLLVPTAADLLSGRLAATGSSPASGTYFGLIELLEKLLPQKYDSITNNGLPSIYCGLCALLGTVIFFVTDRISLKEKLISLGIMVFMLASFIFKGLDYIWHGFAYPTWFPFRNAFLFSAFLVYTAYRGVAALPAPAFAARRGARACACGLAGIVIAVQCFGLYANGKAMIEGLDKQFGYKSLKSYTQFYEELKPLVDRAEADEGFYRIEKTFERSKNDAMTLGYNGITHYSSAYNGQINEFTRNLGFAQTHFWNSYYGSTPITDSLFSVKYIMSRSSVPSFYSKAARSGETVLYQNPFALPVGFMAEGTEITGRGFEAQSSMLSSLSGLEEKYFIHCEVTGGQGEYTITPVMSGPCYMLINNAPYGWGEIYLDGQFKGNYFTSETCCILYLGELEAGQSSILSIRANLSYPQPEVCTLDMDNMLKALDILAQGGLAVESYRADYIAGRVYAGQGGLFFTSIPYDTGFRVRIDGQEVETFAGFETFLCFDVPEGTHEIEIKYTAPGAEIGAGMSFAGGAACLLAGGTVVCQARRRRNKKNVSGC